MMLFMAGFLFSLGGVHAGSLRIAWNGKSDYVIITPDIEKPAVVYASQELQEFLRRITGATLPIVPESQAEGKPAFALGLCKRAQNAGLVEASENLKEDGVLIKTQGRDIFLIGQNERGHIYSVYVFLEKYLGVRFLAWDCTVVPECRKLELPEIDYSYSPPFMYRETLYWNSFPKEIAVRQRLNGPWTKCDESVGEKIDFFPYVHSFSQLIPEKEYFEKHPEYFGLQKGKRVAGAVHAQLCLTNPDVLKIATEKVLKWIEEHPETPIFDVSQNDGNGPCECENCMKIVNEEGTQHGPILRFVNAIADEVAKKYPEKWISTLAYAYSTKPPALTKPRPNVIIRLCHAGCYFHGFETCGLNANFATYIDQWSQLTHRIFIWHYATNFAHYLAPNQNLNGLAKDIKFYGSRAVNGVMVQGNYQGPGGELAELRQYLASQLMWDPSQNPAVIREDFCKGYYGNSAKYVMQFLEVMDRQSEKKDIHAFGSSDPLKTVSPEFVEESLGILAQARKAADTEMMRNRIDKLTLPFWYMKLISPAKYHLLQEDAYALLDKVKKIIRKNKITHIREGEPNAAGWLSEMEMMYSPNPPDVAFNFMQIHRAERENCVTWRIAEVERGGEKIPTIFQHPDAQHDADATYKIDLPNLQAGEKYVLEFGAVITNRTKNGVRFAILVNDKEIWNETKTVFLSPDQGGSKSAADSVLPGNNPFSDHRLDISSYAGKSITLTLRVNALGNDEYDWANWIEPKIIRVK